MNIFRVHYLNIKIVVLIFLIVISHTANGEIDWMTVTLDNDLFIGNDNGYTNGLYVSYFDVGEDSLNTKPEHDIWVKPLMWSMPDKNVVAAVNAYMVGQAMNTPSDIEIAVPDEKELPYSAILVLTNTYLSVTPKYADSVSTSLGIVGPAAFGEHTQKFIHKLIGASAPRGWDTQLENEFVFQFSRARTWRKWVSNTGHFDFLTNTTASIGTLESSASAALAMRYGRGLSRSYATTLFNNSRTANPGAVKGSWFFYSGIRAGYIFNQIPTDGNTFRDSRSIDYKHEFVGFTTGFAYSIDRFSITFALSDANLIQSSTADDSLEDLTQYGTITVGWRM